jgi:phosphate transport system protein
MTSDFNVRKHMDEDMDRLRSAMLKLGGLAESAVDRSVSALARQDVPLAEEVIAGDDEVDDLAHRIDLDCFRMIAKYQPMALDLRTLSSAIHMAVDLERIADIGVNVAESAVEMARTHPMKPLVDIPRMGERVAAMIDAAMRAYLNGDTGLAEQVCAMDDQVDDLERQVFRELLVLMIENPKTIAQGTELINVARNLERAGDHATNLGEQILFMTTGKVAKASTFRRPIGD